MGLPWWDPFLLPDVKPLTRHQVYANEHIGDDKKVAILSSISDLITSIGMASPKLLSLIELFPAGAEPFIIRILNILTAKRACELFDIISTDHRIRTTFPSVDPSGQSCLRGAKERIVLASCHCWSLQGMIYPFKTVL